MKRVKLCSNVTMGTRNILQTTDIQSIWKNLTIMLKKDKNHDRRLHTEEHRAMDQ